MAAPDASPPFNLFQELLLFTDKVSKGTKKSVARDEYVKNLVRLFRGTTFNQLTEALRQLEDKGLVRIYWLGPGDFAVELTDTSIELFHPTHGPAPLPKPSPPPQPPLPAEAPQPPPPPTPTEAPQPIVTPPPAEAPPPPVPPPPPLVTPPPPEERIPASPPPAKDNVIALPATVEPAREAVVVPPPEPKQEEPPLEPQAEEPPPPPLPPEPPLPTLSVLPPSDDTVPESPPESIDASVASVETVLPPEDKTEDLHSAPSPPLPPEPLPPPPPPPEERVPEVTLQTPETSVLPEENVEPPEQPPLPTDDPTSQIPNPEQYLPPPPPYQDLTDDGRSGPTREKPPAYTPPTEDYSAGTPEAITEPPTDPVELEGQALVEAYLSGVSREADEDPRLYIDRARTTASSGAPIYVIAVIKAIEDDLAEAYCRVPTDRLQNLVRVEQDVAGELSKRLGTPLEPDEALLDYLRRLKSMMGRPPEPEPSANAAVPPPPPDLPSPPQQ